VAKRAREFYTQILQHKLDENFTHARRSVCVCVRASENTQNLDSTGGGGFPRPEGRLTGGGSGEGFTLEYDIMTYIRRNNVMA
jgi:hypothetical protein